MPTTFNYVREKLNIAVEQLATGKGNVNDRLKSAFMSFHTLKESDFPEALKSDWKWILSEMTKFGPVLNADQSVFQGSVDHTLGRIRHSTGEKIAKRIFMVYREMNGNANYL